MSYQRRASTDPEPSGAEILFVVMLLIAVAWCFIALWFCIGGEFARQVLMYLAAAFPHQ